MIFFLKYGQEKILKLFFEKVLTNRKVCGIIYCVIQRQQVPVKAEQDRSFPAEEKL